MADSPPPRGILYPLQKLPHLSGSIVLCHARYLFPPPHGLSSGANILGIFAGRKDLICIPKNSETPGLHVSSASCQRSTALPGQPTAAVHVPVRRGPWHAGPVPPLGSAVAGGTRGIYWGVVSNVCLVNPRLRHPAGRSPTAAVLPPRHCFPRALGARAPLHGLTSHPSQQDKTQTKISPCSYIIKKSFSP